MDIALNLNLAEGYKSPTQIAKALSEGWVASQAYCPSCASRLVKLKDNTPVADFTCGRCHEEYELKSKKNDFNRKIVDGAWSELNKKVSTGTSPNFFLLNYELRNRSVQNFCVVPKHFLVPALIEKRKPLSPSARRAGWVGCNILLADIPQAGRIYYVRNGRIERADTVLKNWQKTLFLRDEKAPGQKGWTLSVMKCIDALEKKEFSLDEVYAFENALARQFPGNHHVKDKIRQQLQVLRDKGYLEFGGKGRYKLI